MNFILKLKSEVGFIYTYDVDGAEYADSEEAMMDLVNDLSDYSTRKYIAESMYNKTKEDIINEIAKNIEIEAVYEK